MQTKNNNDHYDYTMIYYDDYNSNNRISPMLQQHVTVFHAIESANRFKTV